MTDDTNGKNRRTLLGSATLYANPGFTKAEQAALEVDGLVAVPPIVGDFNDLASTLHGGTTHD